MAKPLVIVESPAKAKTIGGFLGSDFMVESSIGHIRDLPRNAREIPAAFRSEPWARVGVDVDSDFKPLYVVPSEKKQQVSKLKAALKEASEVYLATDEDREGESIAWHLLEVLSPRVPVRRMVFHEITKQAIEEALRTWRELDRKLVDAQEARRILDRLVGWDVSEVLWKKVMPKLSAGRVQSVATRLVVERERSRQAFRSASFAGLDGRFEARGAGFGATLISLAGRRLAVGRDFDPATGNLSAGSDGLVLDEAAAASVAASLEGASFRVASVESREYRQSPYAPFITSTLQQEAGRKLRFGTARTMQVAQRLYERGYITYMRTDSTALSEQAIEAARAEVGQRYGPDYLPAAPRQYVRKVKNAQEAHEAIRPAGDRFRAPEDVRTELDTDEMRLYDLVWKRVVASQMADARGRRVSLRLLAPTAGGEDALFGANGRTIEFPGFLRAYVEGADDPQAELADREVILPAVVPDEAVDCAGLEVAAHSTSPPARFTEASLVAELETRGIGRPSTYAGVISTIQDRGYVTKKGTALVPSWTAFAVVRLLEEHFSSLVDYDFTARMEEDLDGIARGEREAVPWLRQFYFGNGQVGLRTMVEERVAGIDARAVNTISLGQDKEGRELAVRVGRFGPYLARGEESVPVPTDVPPGDLTVEMAIELLERGREADRVLGTDPVSGLSVSLRNGTYGPYVQLGEAEGSSAKPRRASLFRDHSPEDLTLEQALSLLSLPRSLGADETGEIMARNGRFGPYLQRGEETRSLPSEGELLTISLEEATALFAQPKRRAGAAVLAEIGTEPGTGAAIRLLEGRFGPYVTDGTTNATLPRGHAPTEVVLEEALAWLRAKREAPPTGRPKGRRKKST
ncbi:MAG: type I DNA topoisomerase [Acidimicrobiia bacterium]